MRNASGGMVLGVGEGREKGQGGGEVKEGAREG